MNIGFDGGGDELVGGIGNARRAGVGDEGDGFAFAEEVDDFVGFGCAAVAVVAEKRRLDFVFVEEDFAVAGVFGGDEVDFF